MDHILNRFGAGLDLVVRLLLAQIFIIAGAGKISAYAGTQSYMEAFGVPGELLPLVIIAELGGGLALAAGLLTRWVALALAGFTLVAALIFHFDFAEQTQMIAFMKNVAITGGLLLLVRHGAGRFSLDGWRHEPEQAPSRA